MNAPKRSRAAEALQRIYFAARGGDEAKPLDYVEAISIAKEHEHEHAMQNAIDSLAGAKGVVAEAREIIKSFFGDLPHIECDDDIPPERPGLGCGVHDHDGPTPAPVPGRSDDAERDRADPEGGQKKTKPVPDGKRTVAEMEAAADVIKGATLRRTVMREVALEAMKALRKLAARLHGSHKAASGVLDQKATDLKKASAAAGTESMFNGQFAAVNVKPDSEQELIDAAIARGASTHEVDQIARNSGDYDDLRAKGHIPNQTRGAFVAANIKFEADRAKGLPY